MKKLRRRDFLKGAVILPSLGLLSNKRYFLKQFYILNSIYNSKHIMIAGTASGAGKNTLCCGLHRYLNSKGHLTLPFKPITIDSLIENQKCNFTQSILLQCIAARTAPVTEMNPVRIVYSSCIDQDPSVYINGIREKKSVTKLHKEGELLKRIDDSISKLLRYKKTIIVEGVGALSDWIDSPTANLIIEKINPQILLVVDSSFGGGFASMIGTLELIPEKIRTKIFGMILNRFDINLDLEPVASRIDAIKNNYGVPVIGSIPTIYGIEAVNEDNWPLSQKEDIEEEINFLKSVLEDNIDLSFLSKLVSLKNDKETKGVI